MGVISIAALSVERVCAEDMVSQFYRGRQITVIVGSSAGGGYDTYARLLARHMPKHIPGNPAMAVSNMAGAGSNLAAAHVYNVAPKDGTIIGALQNSAIVDALLDGYSAIQNACVTMPPSSSISAPLPSTIMCAFPAPMRR